MDCPPLAKERHIICLASTSFKLLDIGQDESKCLNDICQVIYTPCAHRNLTKALFSDLRETKGPQSGFKALTLALCSDCLPARWGQLQEHVTRIRLQESAVIFTSESTLVAYGGRNWKTTLILATAHSNREVKCGSFRNGVQGASKLPVSTVQQWWVVLCCSESSHHTAGFI